MDNRKHLKPDLMDVMVGKKIVKTFKPRNDDYWEPTRSAMSTIWRNYIRPNIWIIIIILIVAVFLIYRYRTIKTEKEAQEIANAYQYYNSRSSQEPYVSNAPTPKYESMINTKMSDKPKSAMDEYADMIIELYKYQKEIAREPRNGSWDHHDLHYSNRNRQSNYNNAFDKYRSNGNSRDYQNDKNIPYRHYNGKNNQDIKYNRDHLGRRKFNLNIKSETSPRTPRPYPMYPYDGGTLVKTSHYER